MLIGNVCPKFFDNRRSKYSVFLLLSLSSSLPKKPLKQKKIYCLRGADLSISITMINLLTLLLLSLYCFLSFRYLFVVNRYCYCFIYVIWCSIEIKSLQQCLWKLVFQIPASFLFMLQIYLFYFKHYILSVLDHGFASSLEYLLSITSDSSSNHVTLGF